MSRAIDKDVINLCGVQKTNTMKHQISTEIEINASIEKVWNALTSFDTFPNWNPFIKSITGHVAVGNTIEVVLHPPGGSAMKMKPTVEIFEREKVLQWHGHLGINGIFDGQHRFELLALSEGKTKLIHSEKFKGILVRPLKKMLDGKTKDGFEMMNQALKAHVERV